MMLAEQLHPGIGPFLLAAGRKMISVISIGSGNVMVGIRTVENGFIVHQRRLCPGDCVILRPVLGANAAINKDLFYQKTIPALKSQMEANRLQVELSIQKGLALPDNKYSLYSAYDDLRDYKNAGRLDDAITAITKSADTAKQAASTQVAKVRSVTDYEQLKYIQPIQEKIENSLTKPQLLALVKIIDPLFSTLNSACSTVDPNSLRLNGNAEAAKSVLLCWLQDDSFSTVNQEQWTSAIDKATK